jgi:hypothetical protein
MPRRSYCVIRWSYHRFHAIRPKINHDMIWGKLWHDPNTNRENWILIRYDPTHSTIRYDTIWTESDRPTIQYIHVRQTQDTIRSDTYLWNWLYKKIPKVTLYDGNHLKTKATVVGTGLWSVNKPRPLSLDGRVSLLTLFLLVSEW